MPSRKLPPKHTDWHSRAWSKFDKQAKLCLEVTSEKSDDGKPVYRAVYRTATPTKPMPPEHHTDAELAKYVEYTRLMKQHRLTPAAFDDWVANYRTCQARLRAATN